MLGGSNLGTHMEVIARLQLPDLMNNPKEEKLLKTMRCAAEVLLQTAPRLLVRVCVCCSAGQATGCCLSRQRLEACTAAPVCLHCTAGRAAVLHAGCGSFHSRVK